MEQIEARTGDLVHSTHWALLTLVKSWDPTQVVWYRGHNSLEGDEKAVTSLISNFGEKIGLS